MNTTTTLARLDAAGFDVFGKIYLVDHLAVVRYWFFVYDFTGDRRNFATYLIRGRLRP